ncbi:acyl-CoA dehydrogenase [Collibacillus ludicampi]|uniref:Acyl-CoA dehydrogenase n=1 Tax=Collibacillus ludicampi TaxID=2771369 RepID=A0AAV4LB20_9BACL|nr:acyl-CoA dehydrogenase family protein [Collibacillus ludicampi]GIM44980.1 acyl-CoA dehydrogenase [Collibacillus ludicampi]
MAVKLQKRSSQEIISIIKRLAIDNFASRAGKYDKENCFPYENYKDLQEYGILSLVIPEEYGGFGADSLLLAQVLKEIAKGDGATANTFNMHCSVIHILNEMASGEQKKRFFSEVFTHGKLFASVTSEPSSSLRGAFKPSTIARKVPGGYVVSGTKYFASLSSAADYYNTLCFLDGAESMEDGAIMLMIPRESAGVTVEETWDAMGMRGTASNTVHFNECFVEERNAIGSPGDALRKNVTDVYAFGFAAVYTGLAEAAFDFTTHYAKNTTFKPDPHPISHYPNIQQRVAEMAVKIEAANQLVMHAAYVRDHGSEEDRVVPITLAKYFATEMALEVTDMAIRVCGGRAYMKKYSLERIHRDARAGMVMPPNNDKCLEIIGKASLGFEVSGGWLPKSKQNGDERGREYEVGKN